MCSCGGAFKNHYFNIVQDTCRNFKFWGDSYLEITLHLVAIYLNCKYLFPWCWWLFSGFSVFTGSSFLRVSLSFSSFNCSVKYQGFFGFLAFLFCTLSLEVMGWFIFSWDSNTIEVLMTLKSPSPFRVSLLIPGQVHQTRLDGLGTALPREVMLMQSLRLAPPAGGG